MFTFSDALAILKAEYHVTRPGLPERCYLDHVMRDGGLTILNLIDRTFAPYQVTYEDLMAVDWEVAADEHEFLGSWISADNTPEEIERFRRIRASIPGS